jgi:hypothetical protein
MVWLSSILSKCLMSLLRMLDSTWVRTLAFFIGKKFSLRHRIMLLTEKLDSSYSTKATHVHSVNSNVMCVFANIMMIRPVYTHTQTMVKMHPFVKSRLRLLVHVGSMTTLHALTDTMVWLFVLCTLSSAYTLLRPPIHTEIAEKPHVPAKATAMLYTCQCIPQWGRQCTLQWCQNLAHPPT